MAKFIKAAGPLAVEVVEKFEEANIKGPTHSLGAESLRFLHPVLTDHWHREAAHRLLKEDRWPVGAVKKTMNALVHDMWMSWQWRKGNPLIAEANGVPPATLLVGPPCLAWGWFVWHHDPLAPGPLAPAGSVSGSLRLPHLRMALPPSAGPPLPFQLATSTCGRSSGSR